ncbi:HAMP domain-containing sensor histidine kinase [Aeromicrobium panaciterrae]|uniref:HAMP domain-containing sensor histidine kinase n=1 Tax=Aeromicrobium panaciterrae TaxID=363861 RepID=UPI0031E343A9
MRAPGRTLISRIVWTTLIVSGLAMAAMISTVVLVLNAAATNSVDATLRDRLDVVSAKLSTSSSGVLTELETPDDDIDDTTWIFDAKGHQVDAPRAGARVKAKATSLAKVRERTSVESHDRVYLAAPVRDRSGDVTAVVVVTESMAPYETTRITVLAVLATLGLVVTGGSAAIAAWTIRRTLAPVESMAVRAEDWSEHDLESRFEASGTDDEFGRLGRTLNVLLDRVAGALRSEQQLTSELAHELRTPMTAIRGEAELAMMTSSSPEVTERLGRVVDLVDRMSTTITSLVAIARDDARSDSRTTAAALVSAALEHLDTSRISVSGDDVGVFEISAPTELAVRALSPIVENALRHARSSVTFTAEADDRAVNITVSDDGEGITTDDLESVFLSGKRGTGSDGAGLGLALSRRIARTLGGDVHVTSTSQPTSFTLTLPRN